MLLCKIVVQRFHCFFYITLNVSFHTIFDVGKRVHYSLDVKWHIACLQRIPFSFLAIERSFILSPSIIIKIFFIFIIYLLFHNMSKIGSRHGALNVLIDSTKYFSKRIYFLLIRLRLEFWLFWTWCWRLNIAARKIC